MTAIVMERNVLTEATQRGLARAWIEFESALVQVPLISRMLGHRLRLEDYQRLLVNLRQQVVEGSRWISRAASNLGPEREELRSLFVRHAVAEHRDYRSYYTPETREFVAKQFRRDIEMFGYDFDGLVK